MQDFGYPQVTDSEVLKGFVTAEAEKIYNGTIDYFVSQIPLDKLRLTDSVSEKESEKSIVKCSHDMSSRTRLTKSNSCAVRCSDAWIICSQCDLTEQRAHNRVTVRMNGSTQMDGSGGCAAARS